ncbi:hypothetical protein SAMN05216327_12313 [Dyadobacter sp. SG02]|uniref:hypothetical protein n=1 Tax=Dyadobacter sp. SG02 TaxID=1855291 RepID=UPI0008D63668|nr:hypothetical protein [Dyadobacter sp. SG02]SEJ83601.1 hypothetical protein SAMN05216327_12313 [Dyadobacter sp. SG02]
MKSSNIFVYLELTKFTQNLSLEISSIKSELIAQHAYFRIIPANLFSEYLSADWNSLCENVNKLGPVVDSGGRVVTNNIKHTIQNMTDTECFEIAQSLQALQQNVADEFR